jgi:hypothetical protein
MSNVFFVKVIYNQRRLKMEWFIGEMETMHSLLWMEGVVMNAITLL